MKKTQVKLQAIQGNHSSALAAIDAGCRFYAGYPITPSSEVAEKMSSLLPDVDGVFIQMEDEIASMGAILGASLGGKKVMTATSGPGFSLKQEHIGFAAGAEIPCVIINVMRGGPSTGMPTRPSQGDVMQARWGTHGDHPVIVLAPDSVAEIYQQTLRAFNLAEQLRVPVVVLFDEVLGHLVESIAIPEADTFERVERKWASGPEAEFQPYRDSGNGVPEMAMPGSGYRVHTTGLTHAEHGFPTQDPEIVERVTERLFNKISANYSLVESYEAEQCEKADVVIVAYGITARATRRALRKAREKGIGAGLFRPVTLWPFPQERFIEEVNPEAQILVPEMNRGQLSTEIERIAGRERVTSLPRFDGEPISPQQILEKIVEITAHG
ncbi:MAG: 2-oxoacid:acceptor oxidoreductase subunit alpha [Arenicellales bacterium]|jgi:2-oxoglutarate ferredoxin oxidoreductase subunit alpha|nr:2-oxoglutarate synthase subunit alpha [Acidiferrobacteraceae bacterium]MDP6122807.1 2-oxoacid:acceptor oxidoreductase subunit alpha [Arenicellales bacterium]|tara:strand:+ start:5451 stop:6599 length:1149 start_codon:yes stop_codon:yes gene_type:complete